MLALCDLVLRQGFVVLEKAPLVYDSQLPYEGNVHPCTGRTPKWCNHKILREARGPVVGK